MRNPAHRRKPPALVVDVRIGGAMMSFGEAMERHADHPGLSDVVAGTRSTLPERGRPRVARRPKDRVKP